MRAIAAFVVVSSLACSPRAAKTSIVVGGVSTVLGTAVVYDAHCCTHHSGVAPDGRIVAYPVGGALIIAGAIAMITGLISLAVAD